MQQEGTEMDHTIFVRIIFCEFTPCTWTVRILHEIANKLLGSCQGPTNEEKVINILTPAQGRDVDRENIRFPKLCSS